MGRTNGNRPLTSEKNSYLAMRPKKKDSDNPYQKTTFTIYLLHISFLHSMQEDAKLYERTMITPKTVDEATITICPDYVATVRCIGTLQNNVW